VFLLNITLQKETSVCCEDRVKKKKILLALEEGWCGNKEGAEKNLAPKISDDNTKQNGNRVNNGRKNNISKRSTSYA